MLDDPEDVSGIVERAQMKKEAQEATSQYREQVLALLLKISTQQRETNQILSALTVQLRSVSGREQERIQDNS